MIGVGHRDKFELTAAITARGGLRFGKLGLKHRAAQPVRPAAPEPDQPANIGQLQSAVGAHEAVITNLLKSGRQDVLSKGPHKRFARKATSLKVSFAGRFDPVDDFFVGHRKDPVVGDCDSVNIGSQILQHRLSVAHRFEVDHPVEFQHAVRQLLVESGLAKLFDEQLLVQHLGGERMEQLILVHLQPLRAVGTHTTARHDEVYVRMIVFQVPAPGMQHAQEAELLTAQVLRLSQQRPNRLAAGTEDGRVTGFRVGAQQGPQFLWNRKSHDEMLHGQQFAGLPGEPLLRLFALAMGTMAIAAGTSDPVTGLAGPAAVNQIAQLARSTAGDQSQYLAVMGWHPGLILGEIVRSKLPQCIGDRNIPRGTPCIGDRTGRLGGGEHLAGRIGVPMAGGKQLVNHLPGIGFGDLGQVQVDHRGLQARMPQVFLDRFEADAGFQQMGGVRMAQSVARN